MDNGELNMTVSSICVAKDGSKFAYVSFTDKKRLAEGKIPECVITTNKGFTLEEVASLEDYMRKNVTSLKKMAAGNNLLKAIMKDS